MRKMRIVAFAATTIAGGTLGVIGSRFYDGHVESEVRQDIARVVGCERGEQPLERSGDGLLYCSGVRVYEVTGETSVTVNPDYNRTIDALNSRVWDDPVSEVVGAVGMGAVGVIAFDAALVVGVGVHDARQRAERNRGGVIRGNMI